MASGGSADLARVLQPRRAAVLVLAPQGCRLVCSIALGHELSVLLTNRLSTAVGDGCVDNVPVHLNFIRTVFQNASAMSHRPAFFTGQPHSDVVTHVQLLKRFRTSVEFLVPSFALSTSLQFDRQCSVSVTYPLTAAGFASDVP